MILRNFKSAWRNILKNKLFSIINILGLSIGFAVTTLILFWVVDELNFDKFHENIDNIYTVYEHQNYSDGQELFTGCTPFPLSTYLKENFPEVELATTYSTMGDFPIEYDNQEFMEGPVIITDSNFLNIYSFNVIEGDRNALSHPNKIVITQELATLFFKNEPALGKTLTVYGNSVFEVGAIVEKLSKNSTIDFGILLPLDFLVQNEWTTLDRWGNNWPQTRVLLSADVVTTEFDEKIRNLIKDKGQENTTLHAFPFKDSRLYSYSGKNNRVQYVYQFLAIAFIIILIASINFVNFSIARSEKRRSEVGIRKAIGATRLNITQQFLSEKGLMVFISFIISVVLLLLFLPLFGKLSDKTISLSLLQNRYLIAMLLAVVVGTVLLSVAYPALYVSSFSPARVIKKQSKGKSGNFSFRSSLMVLQFALSIGLIICSVFISNQLQHMNNYDLGYKQDNLICLDFPGQTSEKHEVLSEGLTKLSGVESITKSDKLPFWGGNSSWGFDWEGKDPEKLLLLCQMQVDRNYFSTMGINFESGKAFSEIFDRIADSEEFEPDEVILNQEAIRRMGMEESVGKRFGNNGELNATIVGVVEDFHFVSLRNEIEPLLITPLTENPRHVILRIQADNFFQTVDEVKTTWAKLYPETNISLGFFDDRIEQLYNSELQIAGLFKTFTFIAIFIACIGLFGLSLYSIELRRKEIGIRKVNGSTRVGIITLLNHDFISYVIIAFIIACPVAFYAMNKWLQNFAYKTTLSWWVFILSGLLALLVAIITVSWQSWLAATRNPVEALKCE